MYNLALIIFVVSEKKAFEHFPIRKSKMAATAIHRLTLDPMGKCSNAFFSETTNIIKAKLYMNVHIIFVVSEKKAFEHFPIGFNVNLCITLAAILDFRSA
jgi:hypothetical protein